MTSIRFRDWNAQLRSLGCEPEDIGKPLNTAEWWRSPWGALFAVPAETDGRMDEWALQRLVADLLALAPQGWPFPKSAE